MAETIYKHKKRGTTYAVIGVAEVQTANRIYEGDRLTVYRGQDGRLWARPEAEFNDGRFEAVHPTDAEILIDMINEGI